MEHLGRGPCEFGLKPIRVCLRSPAWKLVYESPPECADGEGTTHALYDLAADPDERTNLADGGAEPQEAAAELAARARARCAEVRRAVAKT